MLKVTFKDQIKMILWRLRKTIPGAVINCVCIRENHEKLVDIKRNKTLFFSQELQGCSAVYLRASVYEKIQHASQVLPNNYFFKIYSAFRSQQEQMQLWQDNYREIKEQNPTLPEEEIIRRTKARCADPRSGFGGHQTGGAVDISLCDQNGQDYDMGTGYLEVSFKIITDAKGLIQEQKKNRALLKKTMENEGFKNYPYEWWHFCYGDRMWAAYSGYKECFYGMPSKDQLDG